MSTKITVNALASRLADAGNVSGDTARSFLTALFAEISSQLEQGKEVKIKGIGTFMPDGSFVPDAAIAEAVNAPFSFFEPVELAPGVTDEMLRTVDGPDNPHEECVSDAAAEPPLTIVPTADQCDSSDTEPEAVAPVVETETASVESSGDETNLTAGRQEARTVAVDCDNDERPEYSSSRGWLLPVVCGLVGFVLGAALMYLLVPAVALPSPETPTYRTTETDTEDGAQTEIVKESQTETEQPTDQTRSLTKTDTVRSGYYFTTMARRHYGDKSFWVYIYEDNASRLKFGHPERIMPGTVVSIPAPDKYGINPDDEESVETAKAKAHEIYSRFK